MELDPTSLDQNVVAARAETSTPPLRMSEHTAAAATADVFGKHRLLVDWVLSNDGFFHPDAQIAFSSQKGFHVVVTEGQTLTNGTRVASCPMPVTLSVLNALDIRPFSNHGSEFPKAFLRKQAASPQCLQAFFLMEQLVLGERSWWAPYIATLPNVEDINAAQFEEQADAMWLEGTNLRGALSSQQAKWKEMYRQGMGQLRQTGWPNALNDSYTWERFRWAATIFGSRSFTSQVLDATLPADLAALGHPQTNEEPYDLVELFSTRFGVLLPLMDLCNHKPGAKVEWQARYNFVGLQILETYESGQEICNNYGPRDNEGLLLAYGFTIQNNPFDHLVIGIKVPPGSLLEVARTWNPDLRSDPEKRCFIFDHQHPQATSAPALETSLFSFDLLDSISVLCANEREIQSMFERKQTLISYCLGDEPKFADGRLILATLSQLLRDCSARTQRLRATDPALINLGQTPANSKQYNAKVYRDSQLNIVETAVAICKFVLRYATREPADDEKIFASLRGDLSDSVFQSLRNLTKRHTRLIRPFELLTSETILEMIPNNPSVHIRKCLSDLEDILQTNVAGAESSPVTLEKSRLAVILSALYGEYLHGVKLPTRTTKWIKQLSEWYPLDSESWAYVPVPGPWAPGEEPPVELMNLLVARAALSPTMPTESNVKRWLKPERICWGWNVMEEEKVVIPMSILESKNAMCGTANSVLLYWRHY